MGAAALITAGIFLLVFIAISTRLLNEVAAALLGASAVFLVTYILGTFIPELSLLTFEEAMNFVDWNADQKFLMPKVETPWTSSSSY